MSKLFRADIIRMFRSFEFMACALVSLALGLLNVLFSCITKSPSYQPTFDKDFFTMSAAVVFVSSVFVGLFFGTGNSVVRNKLIVGHTRGAVFGASCLTAFCGTFIINAANLLPYALIAPLCGAEFGELTAEEFMLNVLIEVFAVNAAGVVCFLMTVIFTRKSLCAAGSLLSATIMMYLPEIDSTMRYSPLGQLQTLRDRYYTDPFMAACSMAIVVVTVVIGAAVFRFRNIK